MCLTLSVLAAGIGSRYGGLKQIEPVGPHGETILDYSIFDARQAGFEKVAFVIRRDIEKEFREIIGQRFEKHLDVAYAFQELDAVPDSFAIPHTRQKSWGTAHAVLTGQDVISAPFGVINADDFYGADSYRILADFLQTTNDTNKAHYALTGFTLGNTLSEHGHVSRGICTCDDQLYLRTLTERTHIVKHGTGAYYEDESEQQHPLSGDEWVSMNMWGFTPSIFNHLQKQFADFLEGNGQDDQSEFFITSVVNRLLAEGQVDVRVLPTTSTWFGITYREDKPALMSALRKLTDNGAYPSPLWG